MNKRDIEREIELAEMMVADLEKIFKKYAKAAQAEAEARQERIKSTKYFSCSNVEELQTMYGYGELTEKEYYAGLDFFEELKLSNTRKSLIEQHRQNVKELRDRWKGTVLELTDELAELDGVKKGKPLTYIEQLEAKERNERYESMK